MGKGYRELSGADPKVWTSSSARGMWLNVAAAMGVDRLSADGEWVGASQLDSF